MNPFYPYHVRKKSKSQLRTSSVDKSKKPVVIRSSIVKNQYGKSHQQNQSSDNHPSTALQSQEVNNNKSTLMSRDISPKF
jgi:hypothetical protein